MCLTDLCVKLTQSKGRLAELELVVTMAAVVWTVSRGGRRGRGFPHQQIIVDPYGERDG